LFAYRTFQQVRHAECAADRFDRLVAALEVERRRAAGDLEVIDLGQRVEDFLGYAVGEVLLVLGLAQICEGQYGDGFRVAGGYCGRSCRVRRCIRLRRAGCIARRCQHKLVKRKIAQRQKQHDNDHAIHPPRRLWGNGFGIHHFTVALQAFRRQLKHPGNDQRGNKTNH
jgi:hypothetical protein